MASPRNDPGFFSRAWPTVALGVVVYGGSLLFGQVGPQLPAKEQVVEVRIEGNLSVPKGKILRHVRTRPGRPFDSETIEEDVRRLNRTRMFVDVETFSQQVPGGRVVVFRVLERPTLQDVKYVGNRKIKTKVLQKETDLKVGDALDPSAIQEARRKIEDFYRSKGFSKVHVTLREGNKPGDRRAVFLINEGPKQKVLWTRFVGNTIASDARLRTQIQSKPPMFYVFGGEVNRKQIDEDIKRLTAYYRSLGYFSARIGRELDFNAKGDWLTLTFVIDEGPRYKVRNVSLIGNTKFATEELMSELTLQANQDYHQAKMNSDVAAVREKYGAVGYIFAEVKPDVRFFEQPGELDLVYNIREGERYRVGRINVEIKGDYPHTKITTVLNRLGGVRTGEIMDVRKLRAAERRLRRSGLYEINPQNGTPKIVFSRPEPEEAETQVARPPGRGPNTRFQSPDLVPCDGWTWVRAASSRPGDRRMDLILPCRRVRRNVPSQVQPGPASWSQPGPTLPPLQTPAMTVRAQNGYSPEAGWTVPTYQPRLPGLPAQPPRSNAGGQTTAGGLLSPRQTTRTYPPDPAPRDTSPWGASPRGTRSAEPGPAYRSRLDANGREPITGLAAVPTQLPATEGILSEDSPFFGGLPDGGPTRPLPLEVIAEETQTGRFMFGAGINSDAGLVGSIVIDERNFDWTRIPTSWEEIRNATAWRGAGQRFRLEAVPGTQVQRYMINFQEPYLLNTDVSLGLSFFFYDRRFREWDEQRLGGRVSLGYQFTPALTGAFSFRGAKINIHHPVVSTIPELNEVVGDSSLYGFRLQLAHDTRDSAFLATEGHLVEMAFEQVTGSFDYPRAELDVRKYFLMGEHLDRRGGHHVLSLSARMGISGSNTPIYDHYYAGGFSTIRGFDFRGASPRDVGSGVLIGGHFQLLASAQYMFPITADDMLRAVVFCDTGTVQPSIDNWTDKYRVAPGFGLRIIIPAMGPAPIALDFAFPISTEPGDHEEAFSFFLGINR